jgi:hypothetical protein
MKTKTMLQVALALVLANSAFTITGCSSGGGDTTPAVGKLTVENYPVTGVLKETDGFGMPGTIALTATDANGNPVKLYSDMTGGKLITSITADVNGIVNFFVDGAAVTPITITAAGSTFVPNHISGSAKFTITKPGPTNFAVYIVDMDVPSPGVAVAHLENGTLDTDDVLTTPFYLLDPSPQHSAEVTIPVGTVFKDSTGNNLKVNAKAFLTTFASSTATSDLIDPRYFDKTKYDAEADLNTDNLPPMVESDLNNFPGGLNSTPDPKQSGYFVTAGFVSVNVADASGKQAKKIANGTFDIRLNIASGTVNPDGNLVTAGDLIPVYTYDEKTLLWKAEVDGVGDPVLGVVKSDANGLYVLHTANHFSLWNLGWVVTGKQTSCSATMNLTGDAIAMPLTLTATLAAPATGKATPKTVLLTGVKAANDNIITASNVPNQLLNIVLTDPANKVIWTSKTGGVNWCAAPITANYTAPANKQAVAVTVNVTEYCSQDPKVTRAVPCTSTQVTTAKVNIPKNGKPGVPPVAYAPISFGVTTATGTSIHNLVPGLYTISAYDRRTAAYYPAPALVPPVPLNPVTVVAKKPQTVNIAIPVTCQAVTGATGGVSGYILK